MRTTNHNAAIKAAIESAIQAAHHASQETIQAAIESAMQAANHHAAPSPPVEGMEFKVDFVNSHAKDAPPFTTIASLQSLNDDPYEPFHDMYRTRMVRLYEWAQTRMPNTDGRIEFSYHDPVDSVPLSIVSDDDLHVCIALFYGQGQSVVKLSGVIQAA